VLEWAIHPAARSRRFHSLPAPSFRHIGPRGGADSNSTRSDLLCGTVKARFAFILLTMSLVFHACSTNWPFAAPLVKV